MKTKTLVLTTLLSLASSASLFAQVYSQNVVGYVQADAVSGFNILANPFNSGTNGIAQVVSNPEEGTLVYKMKADGSYSTDMYVGGAWLDFEQETPSLTTLSPGQGFFLYAPSARTYTFIGEIQTGSSGVTLRNGFSLIASVVPQSYQLTGTNFPTAEGMFHYKLNPTGLYTTSMFVGGQWLDADSEEPTTVLSAPANALASGFFLYNPDPQTTWTRSYTIN